jgi:hypothetical protein
MVVVVMVVREDKEETVLSGTFGFDGPITACEVHPAPMRQSMK